MELATKFTELVEEELRKCKRGGFVIRADATMEEAPCAVKKEMVMLPKFSGDKRTAYLEYPTWKRQWTSHIINYEEKC